jgi:hypothetical protein
VQKVSYKHINPFLETHQNRAARLLGYGGLAIGIMLLLCALQMYININHLLRDKNPRKNGFDFISVTKLITNENIGKDNRFTPADVQEMATLQYTDGAAPLIANQFRVKASAGNIIPFSTDLFLEALDEKFIDTVPPSFSWKPGEQEVPIIFSSDFLEMYNVFAPGQDLPQLSAETISSVNILLECYGPGGTQTFRAHIVALSDRINSVLVPPTFMNWANGLFGGITSQPNATRVYLKTTDANNPDLLKFLEGKQYRVNKDKTKFGRIKQVLQGIVTALGGFGVLVVLLAMVLFSFYLQLMIAKSKENLQLLFTLGYAPGWLGSIVSRKWIPVYAFITLFAIAVTAILHYLFKQIIIGVKDDLPAMLHWSVPVVALALFVIAVWINRRMVSRLLRKL